MTDRLHLFRDALDGAVLAVGQTIQLNGWDPLPGSQAAAEIDAQAPFVGRSKAPVADALAVAGVRLAVATTHVAGLSTLLKPPPNFLGSATVARVVLETSAKATWALDPTLDVKRRIARGRATMISNLNDQLSYPRPVRPKKHPRESTKEYRFRVRDYESFVSAFDRAQETLDAVIADTEDIGLEVKRGRTGKFVGIEEPLPGPTDTIKREFGDEGAMAYRDLSGIAHGGISSVINRMEEVESRPSSVLMKPREDVGNHLVSLAAALLEFGKANDARIALFGWDPVKWLAWRIETRDLMRQMFPS
jgi:hypothetical protein